MCSQKRFHALYTSCFFYQLFEAVLLLVIPLPLHRACPPLPQRPGPPPTRVWPPRCPAPASPTHNSARHRSAETLGTERQHLFWESLKQNVNTELNPVYSRGLRSLYNCENTPLFCCPSYRCTEHHFVCLLPNCYQIREISVQYVAS